MNKSKTTTKKITKLIFILILVTNFFNCYSQNHNIILGRPTHNSITVSVMFDNTTQYYIEYGVATGSYPNQTTTFTSTINTPNHIDINGLTGNTKYFYRLMYKSGTIFIPSQEYSFHTQRGAGDSFTFTVEADEHLYDKKGCKNMYNVTLQNQAADNPDFMLTLGDIFGDDHEPFTITSGALDTLHRDYRPFLGSICHSIPFFICLGNHEGENDYYQSFSPPNNLCYWGTQWRKFYYPNPYPNGFYSGNDTTEGFGIGNPENYYSWTWGDALFVVLDVYRTQCRDSLVNKPQGWNWTLGLPQYTWLKNTLESSNANFKFVFAHHLRGQGRGGIAMATTNEWGGNQNTSGNYTFPIHRPGWDKPIHQLFRDNNVTMFVQGHDHVFAHEVLDSVIYIAAPMAADSTYQIGMLANADAYVSDTVDGTGHLRFMVSSDCVKMDYIKAYLPQDTISGAHHNREVGFSVTVGACSTVTKVKTNDALNTDLEIFPNPSNNSFSVKNPEDFDINMIQVTDILGRKIYQISNYYTGMIINTQELPDGFYLVNAFNRSNRKISQKLIVSHD